MNVEAVGGPISADQLDSLVAVLEAVRHGAARTRPQLTAHLGYGRNLISQRVERLLAAKILREGRFGPSTGGRAPRELSLNGAAGRLLVAELDTTYAVVALSDLDARLYEVRHLEVDVRLGPVPILDKIGDRFDDLLAADGDSTTPLWGIGLGVPGPVEFATGRPVAPPIMPGWDDFDIRGYLAHRFSAPVYVDNDVNVMALGELRSGLARNHEDVIYLKVGAGIGAGIITAGRLHRGAQGSAGDVGHIPMSDDLTTVCRCGKVRCIEASAGGLALERRAAELVGNGESRLLADRVAAGHPLTVEDIKHAALHWDPAAQRLLRDSAHLVGDLLAQMASVLNPALILVGGVVADSGETYLAEVRQVVFQNATELATRSVEIRRAPEGDLAGLRGAAALVVDALLSKGTLGTWIEHGTPAELTSLSSPRFRRPVTA